MKKSLTRRAIAVGFSLLMAVLLVLTVSDSSRAAGGFVETYFSNGISKPEKPYLNYSATNTWYDELTMYFNLPKEIMDLEEDYLVNYEQQGNEYPYDYRAWIQYDFRVDDGNWHNTSTAVRHDEVDQSYENIYWGYFQKGTMIGNLSTKAQSETILSLGTHETEEFPAFDDLFGHSLIRWTDDNGEQSLRLDLANHTYGFRFRFLVSYWEDDEWQPECVVSPWSDEVTIGQNSNQQELILPAEIPGLGVDHFEVTSTESRYIHYEFYLESPDELFQTINYYRIVEDWDPWYGLVGYYRVNRNGSWSSWSDEVYISNGWSYDSGLYSGYIAFDENDPIQPDDLLQFRFRIESGYDSNLNSKYSKTISINAPWIPEDHIGHNVEYTITDAYHKMHCIDCEVTTIREAHDFRWKTDAEATCEANGYEHEECEICHFVRNENTVIPQLYHHPELVEAVPATCSTAGLQEHYYCDNCKKYYTKDMVVCEKSALTIAALDHTVEHVEKVDSTCQVQGYDSYYVCRTEERYFADAECRDEISSPDEVKLPLAAHCYEAELVSPDRLYAEATCTSKAVYYLSCIWCEEKASEKQFVFSTGEPLPHDFETIVSQAATITAAGYTDERCKVCQWIDTERRKAIPYPKTITLSYTEKRYAGAPLKPTVTVTDSEGNTVSSTYYSVAYSDNNAAGTAKVTLTFKDKYSGKTSVTFTITKGKTTVTLSDKSATYTGSAISIGAAAVTGTTGAVTYTYYTDSACTVKTTATNSGAAGTGKAPVFAGTYYVKATAAADDNYVKATSAAAKLTINKKASTIKLTAKSAPYTGKAITIAKASVTGSTGAVTYTYYTDSACTIKTTTANSGASGTGKAPKNRGTYYVKAKVAADGNFKTATSTAVKLTITIGKTTVTLAAKTATYTGNVIKIGNAVVTGTTGKVTYVYYTDSACTVKTTTSTGASAAGNAPKNAGTYYVKATAASDGNFEKATSAKAKLVIQKAAPGITVTTTKKTFKAADLKTAAKTFTVSVTRLGTGAKTFEKVSGSTCLTISSSGKITVKKGTKAGTYTIKIKVTTAETKNYKAGSKTATITVVVN